MTLRGLIIDSIAGAISYRLGRWEGRREMAEHMLREYPQIAYWMKLKSRG